MMRRSAARFVLACIPLVGACSPVARDADVGLNTASGATSGPTSDVDRLRGFAHLASGEWVTTLTSGDVLRQTWRWEPDGQSLRVLCVGGAPAVNQRACLTPSASPETERSAPLRAQASRG